MIDVILLCPRPARPFLKAYVPLSPPLGIGYVAQSLRKQGLTVKVLDLYATPLNVQQFHDFISSEQPRLVGFQVYTESCSNAVRMCKIIKEFDSSIATIVGGPHATFQYSDLLSHTEVDIAARFEADNTILDIWETVNRSVEDFHRVKGIAYKENGQIITTPPRSLINDLDSLGYPPRDIFPLVERYVQPSTVITSRGCPYNCIFCGGANAVGKKYRSRSIDSVRDEIRYLKQIFPNDHVIFWDDSFGYDTERLLDLCRMLRKESNVKWSCGIRVDKVNRYILEAMASSGCVKINFGVESGVQEILDSCRKGITIRQIENAVKLAGKIGIYNSCSFVLPLPRDNPRTLQQTIDFGAQLTRIGATASTFNAATPFPGTVLYEEKRKLGVKLISDKWEDFNFLNPVFETEHLNIAQIRKFLVEAILTWHRTSHGETLAKKRIRDRIRSGDYLGRNVHRC